MLRETMIRTIPVAMTAVEALWTERFHRLRAVRNVPPDTRLKNTQMIASAATIPNRRVSISVDASSDPADRREGSRVTLGDASVVVIGSRPHLPGLDGRRPAPARPEQGVGHAGSWVG